MHGRTRSRATLRDRCIGDSLQSALEVREFTVIRAAGKELQRRQQGDDLLLGDLQSAADAVARDAGQTRLVDEICRRIPKFEVIVHVEHLQRGGGNKISPAAENSGRLRAAQTFTAAEGDEIGAGGDDVAQMRTRRQLTGRVDENWDTLGMCRSNEFCKRRPCMNIVDIQHAGRHRTKGGLELPSLCPTNTRASATIS